MPQPTRSDVHVVSALTNVSIAYMQAQSRFVANQVFPIVPVEYQSDKYFVFDSADFRRNNAKPRAPGTESAGGGFDISTATYTCEVYSIHKDLPDQIRRNSDPAIDLDRSAAEFVMQQLLIQKESDWASTFFDTGVWGTDVVGGTDFTVWDDGASTPRDNIITGASAIAKKIGNDPNTLVVGREVHDQLKDHPLIKEQYKYTSSESLTPALLANYFDVDRYIVGHASYTSSEEGASSETNAFILGKHALLCHVPPNPGLMQPAAGYTFAWRGFTRSNNGYRTKRFRMEQLDSDRIESEWAYDHKATLAGAGYFFSGAVS